MADKQSGRLIAENRKAFHDYLVVERFEVGISLTGTEVKSVRAHHVNLRDSYARIADGELWLERMHISPYEHGNRFNHDPWRRRKLLMKRREIQRLAGKVREKGYTLVPLKMYWKGDWAKVELALVRGKVLYDKREALHKREERRTIERAMKAATR